jgi:hypothetical protein
MTQMEHLRPFGALSLRGCMARQPAVHDALSGMLVKSNEFASE